MGVPRIKPPTYTPPPLRRVNCVKILMYSYALVAPGDADGTEWRTSDGAMTHLTAVGQYARRGRKSSSGLHIMLAEAEPTIRNERRRLMQQDQQMS